MQFHLVARRAIHSSSVMIHGRSVPIARTKAAEHELVRRTTPLTVELELYFSCLVKKFVSFHDHDVLTASTIRVTDKLNLVFRVVTSTPCMMDAAERLGRQPEVELDTAAARKLAPREVQIDFVKGAWVGSFLM